MESLKYLNMARALTTTGSDYKLAQLLGISENAVNQYRLKRRVMDDFTCLRLSELLSEPLEVIVAAANYDREQDDERKKAWARHMRKSVALWMSAALLCAGAGPLVSDHASARAGEREASARFVLCQLLRRSIGHVLQQLLVRGFGRFPERFALS